MTGVGVGAANEDTSRLLKKPNPLSRGGAENVYLQMLVELGAVGAVLYVGLLLSIGLAAIRVARRSVGGAAAFGAVVGWATLGVAMVGLTTPLWTGSFLLTYVFWWCAGSLSDGL